MANIFAQNAYPIGFRGFQVGHPYIVTPAQLVEVVLDTHDLADPAKQRLAVGGTCDEVNQYARFLKCHVIGAGPGIQAYLIVMEPCALQRRLDHLCRRAADLALLQIAVGRLFGYHSQRCGFRRRTEQAQ